MDKGKSIIRIKTLKKMIKHCKNPMEKKSLEKELNEAYKRRKIK